MFILAILAPALETVFAQTSPPLAIFASDANLPVGSKVIDMSSGHSTITGAIHCNSDINISGTANYFRTGIVEYVTGIQPTPDFQGKVTLVDCPVVMSTVQPLPVTYQQSDFAPGGTEALAAQAVGDYHHIVGNTHLTAFIANGVLRKGLYYIEGSVNLGIGSLQGQVTLVATGPIIISGTGENWQPYTRCLLAYSTQTLPYYNPAINISGGSSQWSGVLFAPNAGVQISGSGNTVNGGALIGLGIQLTGSALNLTGIDFTTCAGTPTNQAPVVNAGPDQAVNVHTNAVAVTLAGSVTDDGLPVGGKLESFWSLVSGPGPVSFADPTLTNTTVSLSVAGIYVLRLTADDSALTNSDDVIITFDRPDNPPVAYDQSVTNFEETTAAIVLEGSDPDGDPLTFSIVTQPAFGDLSGTAPNVSYTPKAGYYGPDSFTFKVSDGLLESAEATVSITNLHVNHAPLAEFQAVTTPEETPTNITLTGSDADGDALTFTIVAGPTNGTLVVTGSTYSYTPASNYFGADAFSFTASDGITNSSPGIVSITVTPVDKPPLVDAGPDQLISLPQNTTQLAGTVVYEDFPGTVDSTIWSQLSGPGTATFTDPSNVMTTVTFSQSGIYELQLVASDSFLSGTNQVQITVNAPPTVNAGPNQTNTLPGTITVSGFATDDGLPTNGTLSVVWTEIAGPGTVVFANPNDTNTTVAFSQSGVYTLRLTASDGATSASNDVTVLANDAPLVDAGSDQTITNLQTVLNGTAFDDGLPTTNLITTWSVVSGPGPVTFADSGAPVTTATFSQPGVYVLQLSANDSLAISSSQVTISVDGLPVITASGDQFVLFPGTANLTATAVDTDGLPPGSVLTYGWSQVSGPGAVSFTDASALTTTASFSTSGVYTVQFQASDTLLTAATNLTIIVDQAPVVSAGLNQVISLSATAGLHGTVSDDGIPIGAALTVEWAKVSGPGAVRFGNINAADTTAVFSQPGIYTLELVASDTIASSSATVMVTVTPPGANQPPSVYAGPNQTIGGTNTAKLAGVVSDDNFFGTGFLYSWWSVLSGPGTVSFADGNAPATVATFSTAGTYVLTLSATDSQYTNSSQVTITIYPDNQPPTVYPGPNQSIFTSTTTLAGQVRDDGLPAGSALSAHWSQVSGPGAAFFAVPSSAATAVAFNQPGTYVLQLTGSDTQYSVSSNVTIVVQFNQAPVVNAGTDQEIVNTNQTTLRGFASDDGLPTGSTLSTTWSLVNGPSTATFANIHATNTTVAFGDQGAYQLRLTATDGQLTGSDDVTIIVAGSNSIPYQATNVLYRYGPNPSTNFFLTNLDESTYTNGQAGFGDVSYCPLNNTNFIHTIWPGYNPGAGYLQTRRHFFIPPGTTNLDMGFTVDNDALIYINGVLMTPTNVHQVIINNGANSFYDSGSHYWIHGNCPAYDDLVLAGISTNIWREGPNLLAVQARDEGNPCFYDSRISPNAPTSTLLNKAPIPVVNTNLFVLYPSITTLAATIQDDGLPLNATKIATWYVLSGPGTVAFSRPTSSFTISNDVSTLATFSAEGAYRLELVADDSEKVGAVIINVTVSSVSNQPPMVSTGSDQTISLGSSAALNGVATDDGLPFGTLTTSWSVNSGPGDVSFDTLDGTTYATFSVAGDYVLQFSASDRAITSSANVTIHVLPNVGRALHITTSFPIQTDVSVGANLNGQIYDDGLPVGSTLTDQWTMVSGPAPMVFSQGTNDFPAVSVHVDFSAAGSYMLRLTAGDGQLTASADMAITVTDLYQGNQAPVVNAGLPMSATTTAPVALRGSASDDGLPVGGTFATLWTQLSGPTAVVFANAAVTNTTATFNAQGVYVLQLTASDGQLSNSANVTVVVTNSTTQSLLVYAGSDITLVRPTTLDLDGIVMDENSSSNLAFQWAKVSGPGTVTFSTVSNTTQNVTAWLPVDDSEAPAAATFSALGSYVLRLSATDSQVTNSDTLTVTVVDGTNMAPGVSAGPAQSIVLPNVAALHPTATDDGLPNGTLTASWSEVSGPGTVSFSQAGGNFYASFSAAGVYDLRFTASDGQLSSSSDVAVTVFAGLSAPNVEITAPEDATVITAPTNIIGTASSPILQSYRLQYRFKNPDDAAPAPWIVFATGFTSVSNGILGSLDPTLLLNGIYEFQLVATDTTGRSSLSDIQTFSVERNLKIGQFTMSFRDLSVPVSGIPIDIVRTYDSRDQRTNDFGVGWSLDVRNIKLQKTRSLGPNWFQSYFPEVLFSSYALDPVQPREITVTMANDKVYHFQAVVTPAQQFFYPIESIRMTFTNMPGTYGGLAIDGDNEASVDSSLGFVNFINIDDFSYFNPTRFRFTNEVGAVYIIDENGGLQSLTDQNQNTLIIATNGILWTNAVTHNSSVSVSFVRDDKGRIKQIIDPAGHALNYAYGTNGSLATFTDRVTNTTTFAYTNVNFPHYLTGITDPSGVQAIRAVYDDSGRLVQQIDADGNVINFNHDFSNNRDIITDRLGHSTVNYYDDRGNVLATIDAMGNLTQFKYDDVDDLLEKVDALGNTNRYTYDGQGDKLSETDALGNVTHYTYGPNRRLTSTTSPRGFTTTNVIDSDSGVITRISDPLGNVTAFTYDGAGNALKRIDAMGTVISNSYDASGHLLSRTVIDAQSSVLNSSSFTYDTNGNQLTKTTTRTTSHGVETLTSHFTYDGENRLIQIVNPDGSTNRTVYAPGLSKPAMEIDPLGHQTLHFYDERGNETNTVFADSTQAFATFDAENRKISSTDRGGRTTFYTNDALGRLTATRMPDGSVTQMFYDAVGRNIATVDELGNTNRFDYDPHCDCGGRKLDMVDPAGNVTHYSYDGNGNPISMLDALNRTVTYVYDSLNRRVATIFPDNTITSTTYDAVGRRIAETDQNTNTTRFAYDGKGRVIGITNALGKVTAYVYDEVGNLIRQTDANNHVTTYEYDSMGRRIKRTLPGNQVETYAYDLAGNLTNKVDFNGHVTTYTYDALNQLLTETPDPSFNAPTVVFTYTPTGQRASMSDASGVTTYFYNIRDWPTNKIVQFHVPGGADHTSVLNYAYDPHGNVTHIFSSDPNGVDLGYSYDALNRVQNVIDAQTGMTTYGYDAVGNLAGYIYPNNVSSIYTYDSLNRLTNLTTVNAQLSPVAFYRYTVTAGGQRLTSSENVVLTNGVRTINRLYNYDATYQLTHEGLSITDPATSSGTADVNYTLDDVGNRISRQSTLSSIPSTNPNYDANDRLTSDTYDANGNTASGKASAPGTTVGLPPMTLGASYNFENRIVTATNSVGSIITIAYDGDGNRVSKTVSGVTTLCLVDDRNPSGYPQVLEEQTTSGGLPAVTRVYACGLSLISQNSYDGAGWHVSFYGKDGHGNVRYLTDVNGNETDTYDYDAFGTLIGQSSIFATPTPNAYRYCGEQYDSDLGLYYLRARYLNTDSGRFWTQDPLLSHISGGWRLPPYTYTLNNPVNQLDPTGKLGLDEELLAMQIGADMDWNMSKRDIKIGIDYARVLLKKTQPAAKLRQTAIDAIAMGAGDWAYDLEDQAETDMAESMQEITKIYMQEAWANFKITWASERERTEREMDDAFNNLPGPQTQVCSGCGGTYNAPGQQNYTPEYGSPAYKVNMKKVLQDYIDMGKADDQDDKILKAFDIIEELLGESE